MAIIKVKSSKAIDDDCSGPVELRNGEISTETPFIIRTSKRAILSIDTLSPNRRHYETF